MLATSNEKDLRPTLSLLWLFAILNMVFRDIHEFTMASTLNEILSENINGNPMSETVLLFGAFAVELLLLGFLLTALLPPRASRTLNLVLVPVAVAGMLYIPPADPDDIFFAVVQLCAFAAAFALTWRWQPVQHSNSYVRASHAG
ncbi:DUF6326 family protein [uncultured Roseobacter sp.]|uniref:DUF6326 family protein n=1 Tax=uncultured Roseobacter sp. TaxID=114847 RepID=UPI00261C7B4B|nr:DUF6326 family protein [uncultured Roseobacter sp.]